MTFSKPKIVSFIALKLILARPSRTLVFTYAA